MENLTSILDLSINNGESLIKLYLMIIGGASIIVKLTPTLKDDNFLKKIIKFTGKYIALNRSSSPKV